MRGRPWGPHDRTGGSIDDVVDIVRAQVPGVIVERLEETHPADDDNVYFLADGPSDPSVQIDTYPNGEPRFFVEASDRFRARVRTSEVHKASATIVDWLQSGD